MKKYLLVIALILASLACEGQGAKVSFPLAGQITAELPSRNIEESCSFDNLTIENGCMIELP